MQQCIPQAEEALQTLKISGVCIPSTQEWAVGRLCYHAGASGQTSVEDISGRRTGNKRAEVIINDHIIVFLALYRVAFPKCSAAQINAFLYRINYGDVTFRFYTTPQITKAETHLGLTKKSGSTTAYQAYLPINLLKRWMC